MSIRYPIVVRVKRRRDQEPADTLCIVEDVNNNSNNSNNNSEVPKSKKKTISEENQLLHSFSKLSANSNATSSESNHSRGQLILTRVLTTKSIEKDSILLNTSDSNSNNDNSSNHNDDGDHHDHHGVNDITSNIISDETNLNHPSMPYTNSANSSLWIPKGKRLHRITTELSSETLIVVDIHQEQPYDNISLHGDSNQNVNNSNNNSNNCYHDTELYATLYDFNDSKDSMTSKQNYPSSSSSLSSSSSRVRVYDPASRMMDEAIDKAWRVGDFNGIAMALQRGVHVDFQRDIQRNHGITALMAAVKHGNIRMVNRLIENGAKVSIKDSNGKTVIDMLRTMNIPEVKRSAFVDISITLHKVLTKQYLESKRYQKAIITSNKKSAYEETNDKNGNNSGYNNDKNNKNDDGDYVYDIFRYQSNSGQKRVRSNYENLDNISNSSQPTTSTMMQSNVHSNSRNNDNNDNNTSNSNSQNINQIPIVAVEGIVISNDGNVDLVFAYDSDWSDLGDDEDPDSNDERFEGNDYPDEDEGDHDSINGRINEEQEFDHGEDENDENEDQESDSDNSRDGSRWQRYRQENQPVGHVKKYIIPDSDHVAPTFTRDTKSLQKLWGEQEEGEMDVDRIDETSFSRLNDMHHVSGLAFASNPMEFDRNGLPKYGHDLSDNDDDDDDDDDVRYYGDQPATDSIRQARLLYESRMLSDERMKTNIIGNGYYHAKYSSRMPPKDTVAYDSDYDEEED